MECIAGYSLIETGTSQTCVCDDKTVREILSCSSDQDSIIIKVRYFESQCYSLIINSLVYGLFK